jgi:hypothetical protein
MHKVLVVQVGESKKYVAAVKALTQGKEKRG